MSNQRRPARATVTLAATALIFALATSLPVAAAEISVVGDFHPDRHGGLIYFPLGQLSFADQVVTYSTGIEAPQEKHRVAERAVGAPNASSVSLGCRGTLVMSFVDNALVDGAGPDLHVFEIGPAVEPTNLAVSMDGETWIEVGRINGGRADVDLAGVARAGQSFRYVRLTDLGKACGGASPGADIDAVGAIGSALRVTLANEVLFDVDRDVLKPAANSALDDLAEQIRTLEAASVLIEGHADSTGTENHNLDLSRRRAAAVQRSLDGRQGLSGVDYIAVGRGESDPVASNESADGRRANRRVEVVVFPQSQATGRLDGRWTTAYGPAILRTDPGGVVVATYGDDEGRLVLQPDGQRLVGVWVERDSKRRCSTARQGSHHWGRIELELNPSSSEFDGLGYYCDEKEPGGTWTGRQVAP